MGRLLQILEMEVMNSKGAILSNFEVYALLQDLSHRDPKSRQNFFKTQPNLARITFDTIKYLEKTPCKLQSPEIIHDFLLATKDYKLTKAEKLQLINLRPTTPVEMQLIIEDSEERLSEEQVDELIVLVEQHLPALQDEVVNGVPNN